VLRGHEYWVECLAFSPDGKTLVSGALDGTMRFWNVEEGKEIAKLGGPANPWPYMRSVRAVRFTPDGNTLLVGGGPRTLRLFDVATRKESAVLWESPALPPQPVPIEAKDAVRPDGPVIGEIKAAPPPRAWPQSVDIDFSKGLAAYPELRLFGPEAATIAQFEPLGLRFNVPAAREDTADLGVDVRKSIAGDFELTLAYELISVKPPAPPWGAGVIFDIYFDTADDARANVTRTFKGNDAFFGSSFFANDENRRSVRHPLEFPRANPRVTTGRLRLARTGSAMTFQVDEGAGFRIIANREVPGEDVVSIRAMATTGAKPFPADVRFSRLELRWDPGAKIAAPANTPAAEPRSRGWLAAAAILFVVLGVAISAALFIVIWQRRRAKKPQRSAKAVAARSPAQEAKE
jgi:hypothetical protein